MGCAINRNHVRVRWLDGLHLPASSAGTVPGRSARTTDQRHRVRGCHSATPERGEPRWSAATKCRHINPTFRPADDRAHGNHDTINQVMRLGASARGSSAVAKYWVIASCSCSVVAPSAIRHERGAMMPENARNRNQEDAITLAGWGASVHVSGEFVYTANDYAADH
jgi:hypothetical protein